MPDAYRSMVIPAPLDDVWQAVREFGGVSAWHPVIDQSALDSGVDGEVGAVRRLVLADGGVVVERLVSLDDDGHRLVYAILESPFAARNYVSTMHLVPVTESGETFMEWSAQFDCASGDEPELAALFGDGVFRAGLSALRDHVGSAS